MAQAKGEKEVKEPEVKKPETPETKEQKPQDPKEEIDTLRQQLGELETKLTASQEEAKAHQKNVSKKDLELQEAKHIQTSIDEVRDRLDMHETYFAALGDKVGGEGDTSFSKTVQAAGAKTRQAALMRKMQDADREVDGLLEGTGLTKKSPELETAGLLYSMGRYDESVKKVREAVAQHEPPETKEGKEEKKVTETEEERIERLAKEKSDAFLEEKGLLTPEGGEPSAGGQSFTKQQIIDMPPDEFVKNQEAINKARREGRIKE